MPGGPNPGYQLNECCPDGCAGLSCSSEPIEPPLNQPAQKSYKDFNTGWPLDSWSITEPSNGYQINYIRLLSWFAR
jgi:endoglucanase